MSSVAKKLPKLDEEVEQARQDLLATLEVLKMQGKESTELRMQFKRIEANVLRDIQIALDRYSKEVERAARQKAVLLPFPPEHFTDSIRSARRTCMHRFNQIEDAMQAALTPPLTDTD